MSFESLHSVLFGSEDADLVLTGGEVLSTTRRTVVDGPLAIRGDRIAGIPRDPETVIGPETQVIDVSGQVLAPGFIDAHTHLDLHQTIDRSYPSTLAGGTTMLVSEVAAFGPAYGAAGVEAFLESTADLPVKVFATVPPQPLFDMFEPSQATAAETEALVSLLDRDRVVGVGETAWIRMVGRQSGAQPLYDAAKARGMTISGHGAGVSGVKLQAFGTIVTDDHEAISAEGIFERLDAGIHPIGRYGSIRDDMDAFIEAASAVDSAELSLSTDGMWPHDLVETGHMDAVIDRAIDGGVDPIEAIVMATRTPARHFGLQGLGTLAPGTPADIVVLPAIDEPSPSLVVADGEVVVDEDGPTVSEPTGFEFPAEMLSLPAMTVAASDFEIAESDGIDGPVRAISSEGPLLTGETTVSPPRADGDLHSDVDQDILKISLFDRSHDGNRGPFTGFIQGLGLESGAVATSVTWETPGLLVVGTSNEAMARAANHVLDMDGGWAVSDEGSVTADLRTPIGATCADLSTARTAARYSEVKAAVNDLGTKSDRPLLRLQTLAFVGVPSLKLAFSGYADIRAGEIVGLAVE